MTSRYQFSSSNQFGRPVRRAVLSERQQFRIQFPPGKWKHAECTRMSHQALENYLKDLSRSRPIRADKHYSSLKSSQLRSRSSLLVPMFPADQFRRRSVESARLPHSGGVHRYQPYWMYLLGSLKMIENRLVKNLLNLKCQTCFSVLKWANWSWRVS